MPAVPLDLARLHARILQRDEAAMRELVREHGPALLHLAEAVAGRADAASSIVEAAMLELWASAADWKPPETLDLLLYECVRDTALAARRRTRSPRRAAADWQPRAVDARLPVTGLLAAVSPERVGDALLALGPGARGAIDRAWLRGDESRAAEDALDRLCRDAGIAGPRPLARLAALAAISRIEAERANAEVPAGFEHGLISRIRGSEGLRAPAATVAALRRRRARLVLAGIVAACIIAAAAGAIAYVATDGPVGGRAIALVEDGATGVILPRWDGRPAALIFWGLPAAADGERWQLWSVRESGALVAGPYISPNAEGRAAVPLDLDPAAESDPIAGYALTLDNPDSRGGGAPARAAVKHQFLIE